MSVPWEQVARSTVWSGSGAVALRLGQLLVGIIAARVMAPHDFGLFAVAMVVYGIVMNFTDLGTSAALIQEQDHLDKYAPTAVSLSLATATLLTLAMYFSAPYLATVLGGPECAPAIQVMSLVVLLAGPTAVPAAIMTRNFRMDLRFWADLVHFVASSVVMLVLALMGYGVMALAWSRVAGQVASAVALFAMSKKFYRPGFDWMAFRHLFQFGWPLMGTNLVGYTLGNVDSVVIARTVGPEQLGTYTLAANVSAWPLGLLEPVIKNVGLPLFSRARSSIALLNRSIGVGMALLASVYFFGSAMIASLADPIILSLYGAKWSLAGVSLALLAWVGFIRGVLTFLGVILIASNATAYQLWIHIVWIITLIPMMVVCVSLWGAPGAAAANLVVGALVVLPVAVLLTRRASGMSVKPLLRSSVYPMVCSVVAAVLAHLIAHTVSNSWAQLVLGGLGGCGVYALLMWRWFRRSVVELRGLGAEPAAEESPAP